MFKRWSCGCIGIPQTPGDDSAAIVVLPCDRDRDSFPDEVGWGQRDMSGKEWEFCTDAQEQALHGRIQRQLRAGVRFWEIQHALKEA